MTRKSSPKRRSQSSDGDDIERLYHQLLRSYYERGDRVRALPIADRLEAALDNASIREPTIRSEECRSLIAEVRGDLARAIRHRRKEIDLIRRLHRVSLHGPGRDFVLRRYDHSDLSDRLDLLATLYHDSGDLDRAIATLQESRQLCEAHQLPFDGQDLLDDYLEKRRSLPRRRKSV
jgi:tetratricopeptide (TPR) repeat protein